VVARGDGGEGTGLGLDGSATSTKRKKRAVGRGVDKKSEQETFIRRDQTPGEKEKRRGVPWGPTTFGKGASQDEERRAATDPCVCFAKNERWLNQEKKS